MSDPAESAPAVSHWLSRRSVGRGRALGSRGPRLPRRDEVATPLLMLTAALLALALTLALQAMAVMVRTDSGQTMVNTATGLVGLFATIVFAARLRVSRQPRDLAIVASLAILSVTSIALAASPTPVSADPRTAWQWTALLVGLVGSVALLCAVCWRVDARQPRLPRAFLVGVVVLTVASFDYLLVSAGHSGWLYVADILKLLAYALILAGCFAELAIDRRKLIQRAAADERRRMARDMHDGLAQELAFIATHSQRLGQVGDDATTVANLKAAAERALHESRTTIAVLTSVDDAPLDVLIARTAESFRSKFAIEVDLDLQTGVVVEAEQRNALLRILHEALTNAVRHGSAERVYVRLTSGEAGPLLRIVDDGRGFDVPGAYRAGRGLGLVSMGERAEMLGGGLNIFSSPGTGTVVEVGLP